MKESRIGSSSLPGLLHDVLQGKEAFPAGQNEKSRQVFPGHLLVQGPMLDMVME